MESCVTTTEDRSYLIEIVGSFTIFVALLEKFSEFDVCLQIPLDSPKQIRHEEH